MSRRLQKPLSRQTYHCTLYRLLLCTREPRRSSELLLKNNRFIFPMLTRLKSNTKIPSTCVVPAKLSRRSQINRRRHFKNGRNMNDSRPRSAQNWCRRLYLFKFGKCLGSIGRGCWKDNLALDGYLGIWSACFQNKVWIGETTCQQHDLRRGRWCKHSSGIRYMLAGSQWFAPWWGRWRRLYPLFSYVHNLAFGYERACKSGADCGLRRKDVRQALRLIGWMVKTAANSQSQPIT